MYTKSVIYVRLGKYLQKHNITPYRLAKTMQEINGGTPSASAVYAILEGKNTPSLETVNVALDALSKLLGEPPALTDLLEYVPCSGGDEPQTS